jgi:ABC-type lipoprotein export system ATPase subunit
MAATDSDADDAAAPVRAERAMPVLGLEDVSKRFRRGREEVVALAEVTLQVDSGEFVAVVGPSGSGKSTLLHLAGGLDQPDGGRVRVNGRDLAGASVGDRAGLRRREIGFVFLFFHLLPTLSVAENVSLPLLLDGRRDDDRVEALLERVGLADRAGHLPGELSGGEMQRTAVARALVAGPGLILADEPTGNLDSATGEEVFDALISQVREASATLVMVTHDATGASRADRVLRLRDGRLV